MRSSEGRLKLLRTLIVCPDSELTQRLQDALHETGRVTAVRTVDRYPDEVQLSRILRAHGPHLVFLGIQSLDFCTGAAAHVDSVMPGVQMVAVGSSCDAEILMSVMRSGVREFLALPFEYSTLQACLDRVEANLRARPLAPSSTDSVLSFLPSKPGSGTSTLAVNIGVALADLASPGLLADFDLNSGMTRFLLKASSNYSVLDALQSAATMDEELWSQVVNHRAGLDLLHAGRINPDFRIETMHIRHLLDYARRNYKTVCFDLSGNLEKYSVELMHESKKIFVVCTPELSSLHLAREKMQYLHHLDLADRASILLNRQPRRATLSTREIERLVGVPVEGIFPNDYNTVYSAISEGVPVARNSDFAKQCAALASSVLAREAKPVEEKRKFVEYFRIAPARFSFEGRKPC